MANITIKSFSNGLKLYMNQEASFDEILNEVNAKFTESAGFFKNSKLAVSLEGRSLSEDEERSIIKAMEESAQMSILYIIGKDDDSAVNFKKNTNKPYFEAQNYTSSCEVYKGNVKKNTVLEFESSIVIVGDIEPESIVKAKGDIIVLGGLYGSAYAGSNENINHFVFAAEMSPERLLIGPYRYFSKEKSFWSIKPKYQNKIAYVSDDKVVVEACSRKIFELFQGK